MANIFAIGSVIRVENQRFVVVGHRMTRDDQLVGLGYLVVPYPLGFVEMDNLTVIPASRVDALVCAGLDNKEGQDYLAELDAVVQQSAGMGYDDYADAVLLLKGLAENGGLDDE